MEDLVNVTFLEDSAPYAAGEQAGFSKELAEKMVKKGVARFTGQPGSEPETEAKTEPEAETKTAVPAKGKK